MPITHHSLRALETAVSQLQNECQCTSQLRWSIDLSWFLSVCCLHFPTQVTPQSRPNFVAPIGCAISSDLCPCLGRGITFARGRGDCLFVTLNLLSMDSTVVEESVAKTLQTASLMVLKSLQGNYCDVAGVTPGYWPAGEGTPQRIWHALWRDSYGTERSPVVDNPTHAFSSVQGLCFPLEEVPRLQMWENQIQL